MAISRRQRIVNTVQRYVANPLMRNIPIQTLIETVGRTSGAARRTPIGGRKVGDEFWLVAEFGTKSQYVKNIQANPMVRVRVRGRWYTGTAHLLPDDDARARLRSLPRLNSAAVGVLGEELLTIRVDLNG
jgi:deazaflavin-dependent oxidoreductase (nitroreductase family)